METTGSSSSALVLIRGKNQYVLPQRENISINTLSFSFFQIRESHRYPGMQWTEATLAWKKSKNHRPTSLWLASRLTGIPKGKGDIVGRGLIH
jgi:hypothetical protein